MLNTYREAKRGTAGRDRFDQARGAARQGKDFAKDKASEEGEQGIAGQVIDTVKSGAGWVGDKVSGVIPSNVSVGDITGKISDTASSTVDWVKDKAGFGESDEGERQDTGDRKDSRRL